MTKDAWREARAGQVWRLFVKCPAGCMIDTHEGEHLERVYIALAQGDGTWDGPLHFALQDGNTLHPFGRKDDARSIRNAERQQFVTEHESLERSVSQRRLHALLEIERIIRWKKGETVDAVKKILKPLIGLEGGD